MKILFRTLALTTLIASTYLPGTALADKATLMRATGRVPNFVECPNNTDASFAGGVLRCSVTLVFKRASICPTVATPNYSVVADTGPDRCLPQGATINGKDSVPSGMVPISGPPTLKGQSGGLPADLISAITTIGAAVLQGPPNSAYTRKVSANAMDTFEAETVVYLWPQNLPPLSIINHKPANGVACPRGYNDVRGNKTDQLGCEKIERVKPMCQNIGGVGWRLDIKRGEDRCQGPTEGPTKPDGQHGITGDEWSLDKDAGPSDRDVWQRSLYAAPETR